MADLLHHHAGFDHAQTQAALGLGHQHTGESHVGEICPDRL